MRFNIDPDSGVPVYLQISRAVKRSIALGSLRGGEQIPSVREVAEMLTVNPNTVAKAYQLLERDRIVVTRKGIGTFVADGEVSITEQERRAVERLMEREMAQASFWWDEQGRRAFAANLTALAAFYHAREMFREGIRMQKLALICEPNLYPGVMLKGILHARLNEHAAAEATFRSVLEAVPSSIEARKNLGHLYIVMGKPQEAAFELKEALRRAPHDPEAHFLLALCFRLQGRSQALADQLRQVIKLDADGPWGRRARRLLDQIGPSSRGESKYQLIS